MDYELHFAEEEGEAQHHGEEVLEQGFKPRLQSHLGVDGMNLNFMPLSPSCFEFLQEAMCSYNMPH